MEKLEMLISELNNYPIRQNVRPLWFISSDKSELLYYRQYSDRIPEFRLPIEDALSCNSTEELQRKMGV